MLSQYSNKELEAELAHREKNPTWWFRDAIADGLIPDSNEPGYDDFMEATGWMEEVGKPTYFSEE